MALAAMLASACDRIPVRTFDGTRAPAFNFHYLTRDGSDGYASAANAGRFSVSAPSANRGSNTRLLVYPPAQPLSVDQQACATWSAQVGLNTQQGIALRVRHDIAGGDRWRAVTVMKNILWGANWQFNVLTWDTRGGYGYRKHGSVGLPQVFWPNHVLAPLPWRVCARVENDLVTVKAWRIGEPEPAWGDATHGGTVRLPAGWAYAGKSGWYVGHLKPGGSAEFADLTTDRFEIRP